MLGLCRMLLRDPVEAEDASQQAFLSAYRSLLAGTRPEHPAAWLATIARNECWGRIQEGMRRPVPDQVTEELVSPLPGPVESAARRADLAALVSAIGALPPQQRDALLMREFSGLSYAELASALSVSEPAVESLLVRARRELRLRLQPVYAATLVPVLWLRDWFGRVSSGQEPVLGAITKIGAVPLAAKLAAGVATVATVGGVVVAGDVDRATRLPAHAAKVIGVADASAGEPANAPGAAVQVSQPADDDGRAGEDRTDDERGSGGGGEGSSDDAGPSGSAGPSSAGLPSAGSGDRGDGDSGTGSKGGTGSGDDDRPSPSGGSSGPGSSAGDDPAGDDDDPLDEADDEADGDSGEEERAEEDGDGDGTGESEAGKTDDDGEVEDGGGEKSGDDSGPSRDDDSGSSGSDGSDDEPDDPDDP